LRGRRRVRPGRSEATLQKHLKVLQLRLEGLDFKTIAERTGYGSPAAAYAAYRNALSDVVVENADEARALDLKRLDRMLRALWPRVLQGVPNAVQAACTVLRRRSSLLGLDAATGGGGGIRQSVNLIIVGEGPPKELRNLSDQELEEVIASMKHPELAPPAVEASAVEVENDIVDETDMPGGVSDEEEE